MRQAEHRGRQHAGDEVGDVLGGAELGTLLGAGGGDPGAEGAGGGDLGGLGRADAVAGGQGLDRQAGDADQAAVLGQQALREFEDALAGLASAEEERQQFGVAERVDAAFQRLLAWPFALRPWPTSRESGPEPS